MVTTNYKQKENGLYLPASVDLTPQVNNRRTDILVLEDLPNYSASLGNAAQAVYSYLDGEKFPGGFGYTKIYFTDYWTLRQRSKQLFEDNLYARGLIRRLITNEINTGLSLESTPIAELLGLDETFMNDWTDNIENRFHVWASNPILCDYYGRRSFGKLQRQARMAALISGDVLIVLRQSKITGLPMVQLIDADKVQTPMDYSPREGNKIVHGVEVDSRGRHIAFHVLQEDGSSKRLTAYGERSGRRIAWLMYGSDQTLDEVRGKPLLHLVLQSLREIDRYRDSEQRAALINSILAMAVEKNTDKPGTLPITGGAVRKELITQTDELGKPRSFNLSKQLPGLVIEELQEGEKIVSHNAQRPNVNYAAFEAAILSAIAWANEIPPEIFMLQFHQNFSASRGAVNEFKLYLNKVRADFAEDMPQPIYVEWLLSEVLQNRIQANGLLEAWRDPMRYHVFGAWIDSDWSGAIKPSVDLAKEVKGYKGMEQEGWITNDRASKELTGSKFAKNIKRRKRENELKAEALRPLLELEKEFNLPVGTLAPLDTKGSNNGGGNGGGEGDAEAMAEQVAEILRDEGVENFA